MAVAKAPPHIGKTARKLADAAKKGTLVELNKKDRKPLRPGQRHKARKPRKVRVSTTYSEAQEVEVRADKIMGADNWRLRRLASEKILFLYSSAERITGCMDGIVSAGRYPRKFQYKPALRYEWLILVARPRWDRATDEDRTRIAYHGLRHLGMDTADRRRTEPHDFEGFINEVEFFGLRSPDVKRIAEQLQLDLNIRPRPVEAEANR
jgi:hypothetical protein